MLRATSSAGETPSSANDCGTEMTGWQEAMWAVCVRDEGRGRGREGGKERERESLGGEGLEDAGVTTGEGYLWRG